MFQSISILDPREYYNHVTMAAFQDENDHVNQITFAAQVSVLSFSYTMSHYLSFVKKYRASEDLLSCLQGRITKQKQQKKRDPHWTASSFS